MMNYIFFFFLFQFLCFEKLRVNSLSTSINLFFYFRLLYLSCSPGSFHFPPTIYCQPPMKITTLRAFYFVLLNVFEWWIQTDTNDKLLTFILHTHMHTHTHRDTYTHTHTYTHGFIHNNIMLMVKEKGRSASVASKDAADVVVWRIQMKNIIYVKGSKWKANKANQNKQINKQTKPIFRRGQHFK